MIPNVINCTLFDLKLLIFYRYPAGNEQTFFYWSPKFLFLAITYHVLEAPRSLLCNKQLTWE